MAEVEASRQVILEIRREGRPARRVRLDAGVYPVGSGDENAIVLPGDNVGRAHCILGLWGGQDGWLEDLGTPAGTRVDGRQVQGRAPLRSGAIIEIGGYVLVPDPGREGASGHGDEQGGAGERRAPGVSSAAVTAGGGEADAAAEARERAAIERREKLRAVKRQIHQELVERLQLKRMTVEQVQEAELHRRVADVIAGILKDAGPRLPAGVDAGVLAKEVLDEAVGLGPLEDLVDDDQVTEIMVNGHGQVYVERAGRLERTDRFFLDDNSVLAVIERIVSPIGRRIDESQPYVDARLKDGSRVNAIIPPLSLIGPCLTIRKFARVPMRDADLIDNGTFSDRMRDFLDACVKGRRNIVVSGGTGSGKTTLLNVLSGYLPSRERILTIEDAAELQLRQQHVVRMEARPANIEGRGAVTIRDLVRNALRMRPDRIVVGECRGGEALDMLQAMNTGHDGSLTTVHANSPRDVISRLETMVLMSGMELPVRAIREQIAAAIQLIVHMARMQDGGRRVVRVTEVVGLEGDRITMQDVFIFRQMGMDEGRVLGRFEATGAVPTFLDEVRALGVTVEAETFAPPREGDGA